MFNNRRFNVIEHDAYLDVFLFDNIEPTGTQ